MPREREREIERGPWLCTNGPSQLIWKEIAFDKLSYQTRNLGLTSNIGRIYLFTFISKNIVHIYHINKRQVTQIMLVDRNMNRKNLHPCLTKSTVRTIILKLIKFIAEILSGLFAFLLHMFFRIMLCSFLIA